MSHGPVYVSAVKDPTESFGERIGGVDDTRDVFILLDGEILDRDVAGAGGWFGSIDH